MRNHQNLFIVLEGADGSGKTTQFNLLSQRLKKAGYEVEVFDFPRYDQPSAHFVKAYLNGEYGPAKDINPYTASLFYALDRFEAAPAIRRALDHGKIVLSNRYVGSNMAHQGSKIEDEGQQRGFFLWEDGLEYNLLGIPRPTLNLYLKVPAEVSYRLISEKAERSYTKKSHDEHEADISHLRRSVRTYDVLTELFPKDFVAIDCLENGQLLSIEKIAGRVWEKVRPLLPKQATRKDTAPVKVGKTRSDGSMANEETVTVRLKDVSLLAASLLRPSSAKVTERRSFTDSFNYHIPENLSGETSILFRDSMERIKENYQRMQNVLVDHSKGGHNKKVRDAEEHLSSCLPLAAVINLDVTGSVEDVRSLVVALRTNPLPEARQIAAKIERAAIGRGMILAGDIDEKKKNAPVALSAALEKLNRSHVSSKLRDGGDDLRIIQREPRNEFNLVTSWHKQQSSSMEDLPYEKKMEVLRVMLANNPQRLLEQVSYRVEGLLSRADIDELTANKLIDAVEVVAITPRHSVTPPKVIEDAGLVETFSDSFEESRKLIVNLKEAGREELTDYAMLLGQKVMCSFTIQANNLLRTEKVGQEVQKALLELREKVSEVHPIISEYLQTEKTTFSVSSRRARSGREKSGRGKRT